MNLPTNDPARRTAAPARKRADATRTALSPDDWIAAATAVLIDQGIDNVRVDVLAGQLGVTRGSFYHHFRDRDDLLRRLLQAWREGTTEQLTVRLEHASDDPDEQLADVLSLPFRGRAAERAARIELALRAWARSDAMAREFVDEADASRIAHIERVLRGFGFSAAECRHRGYLLYSYLIAESLINTARTPAQRRDRSAFVKLLICRPLES
jgi:AcrR family transcriptional regulator